MRTSHPALLDRHLMPFWAAARVEGFENAGRVEGLDAFHGLDARKRFAAAGPEIEAIEERRELGKKAAAARWGKRKESA